MPTVRETLINLKNVAFNGETRSVRRRARQKRKLYLNQRGKCIFCERLMCVPGKHTGDCLPTEATREHIIPIITLQGGADKEDGMPTICLSCSECNNGRAHIEFFTFAVGISLGLDSKTMKELLLQRGRHEIHTRMAKRATLSKAQNN